MAETSRDRLVRLLGIVTYLDHHGATPFAELADHFGVTSAQIRKDVSTLWTSGLPGYMHGDLLDFDADAFDQDVASLLDGQGVSQVRLSSREAVALVASLSTLSASGVAPAVVDAVLDKLREALAEPVIVLADGDAADTTVSDALLEALRRYRRVELTYVDALDRRTTREVDPHRLVVIDGLGYLECFCRRADDYRTLRLDRIEAVEVLDAAVSTPPGDTAGFSLTPAFKATVRLGRAGRWALEDIPGLVVEDAEDDVIATFDAVDAEWVAGRLLAVAPHLRSVEPFQLRGALHRQAEAVLDAQRA